MYFTFAWRYFKAKKSANAINIIAWVTTAVIAFATCCQLLVLSVFNGFEDLVKSLYSSFYPDIKIIPSSGKTFELTPQLLQKIKQQSFVEGISLVIEEKALLKNEDEQTVVILKGVDAGFEKVSGVPKTVSQGVFATGTADDPLLVMGAGIQNAARISLDPAFASDNVTVILPRKNSKSMDPLELMSEGNVRPAGVFYIQQDFDNNYAFTNIDFLRQQMGINTAYSAVEIKLKPEADISSSKEMMQQMIGASGRVQTKYEQNTNLYSTMRLEKWAIYGVLTLILLIASFNMVSALTMLVLEKKQDIQIMQSMGGSKTLIRRIFLSEGMLLGTIGTGTGIILALIICLIQMKYKWIKLTGGTFLIDYFPVKLVITDFIWVPLTAVLIVLMASWIPASKASRQPFQLR